MHRSRLYGIFVDVPVAQSAQAVAFWSAALGVEPVRGEQDDPYTDLPDAIDGLAMEVQAIGDGGRYHVDIETDDVDAEVARLAGVGAEEVQRHESWVIMRAPGGHLLCVVPVQSGEESFATRARSWS